MTLPELQAKIEAMNPGVSDWRDLQAIMDLVAEYGEERYTTGYEDATEVETGRRNWGTP